MKIVRTYSLEWLDSLVSVTLNPARAYRASLGKGEIAILAEKIPVESLQAQSELIRQVFILNKDSQVRHLIRKYHDTLRVLLSTIKEYRQPSPASAPMAALEALAITSLDELMAFIERRFGSYIDTASPADALGEEAKKKALPNDKLPFGGRHKILCNLSGDQIALILRGADEAHVLEARSMNAVFQSIVPFLSTPKKGSLSAASIRTKAYSPEEADRQAAIDALEAIIRKIRDY